MPNFCQFGEISSILLQDTGFFQEVSQFSSYYCIEILKELLMFCRLFRNSVDLVIFFSQMFSFISDRRYKNLEEEVTFQNWRPSLFQKCLPALWVHCKIVYILNNHRTTEDIYEHFSLFLVVPYQHFILWTFMKTSYN